MNNTWITLILCAVIFGGAFIGDWWVGHTAKKEKSDETH